MRDQQQPQSLGRAAQSASSIDADASVRRSEAGAGAGVEPRPDHATLKRKHGDEHEPSRIRAQRAGRFVASKEAVENFPQKNGGSPEEKPENRSERSSSSSSSSAAAAAAAAAVDPSEQNLPSHWRAVLAFHDMIKDPVSAASKYHTLDAEQKLIIALGVRNLFLAMSRSSSVKDGDRQVLKQMQRVLGDAADPAVVRDSGLRVSFYPSARFSKLQHIQDLDARIGEHPHRSYFAQLVKTPRVFAAFSE